MDVRSYIPAIRLFHSVNHFTGFDSGPSDGETQDRNNIYEKAGFLTGRYIELCEAASRFIEYECNRMFFQEETEKSFYIDDKKKVIQIDDLVKADSIVLNKNDGTQIRALTQSDDMFVEDTIVFESLQNNDDYPYSSAKLPTSFFSSQTILHIQGSFGWPIYPYKPTVDTITLDNVRNRIELDIEDCEDLNVGDTFILNNYAYYVYGIAIIDNVGTPQKRFLIKEVQNSNNERLEYNNINDFSIIRYNPLVEQAVLLIAIELFSAGFMQDAEQAKVMANDIVHKIIMRLKKG